VPSRFGRSLGSGICPGLRECGRFPLAPRCPRLASRGPHLAPSFAVHFGPRGKGSSEPWRRWYPRNWYGVRSVSLFLAGSQVCALRSRGATVRCSLRVWGDNKRRRVVGGSQTRQHRGERVLIRVPIHLRGLTKMTSQSLGPMPPYMTSIRKEKKIIRYRECL